MEASAQVLVQGFKIGTVDAIKFDIHTKKLTVKLNINGKYELPVNSLAKISSTSLLGGKGIVVELGNDPTSLKNNDTIRSSQERSLMDTAGDEYNTLRENLSVLVDKVNSALDGINSALSKENTDALSTTMNNLESTTQNLDKLMASQRTNLEHAIANLAVLSASLKEAAPDLERGLKNLAVITDSLKYSAPALVENAANAVANLNEMMAQIKGGEGTMGKLVTDEMLYTNINETLNNLSLLLADLKENPKKYINVTVFGKKDKSEKK